MEEIVIVGGGIGGLATALALHRMGLKSLVLETSDSLRCSGFALAMWNNAWIALDALGVADSLRQQHTQILEMVWLSTNSGRQISRTALNSKRRNSGTNEARFVERKAIVEAIAKELPKDYIMFSTKVDYIENMGYFKMLHLTNGSTLTTKVLIGADGVNSVVARSLRLKKPHFDGRWSIRGFVHFTGIHKLEPVFLQCIGNGVRFGIVPCGDTSVYWFYIWPSSDQEKGLKGNQAMMKQFVLSNLKRVPPKILEIIDKTKDEDVLFAPLSLRPPWELFRGNISKDNVCVVGDAFHPMTPDLGQGGCSTLEDAIILAKHIGRAMLQGRIQTNKSQLLQDEYVHVLIKDALTKYSQERKWRVIGLTSTAFIVGNIQQSCGKLMSLLREQHVLSSFLAKVMVNKGDYDCGKLMLGNKDENFNIDDHSH
ncbi:monooxygenase 3-like isoform X1 [Silene latifolia]|uniref:monooxygenase 3-like isoform X1 n=1 Tax=Silene latifolia TaxID=37657 RepID=UPI003D77664E